jgi:hypothetical protein
MSAILDGTQDCLIQFLKKTTQNEPFVKMNLIETFSVAKCIILQQNLYHMSYL